MSHVPGWWPFLLLALAAFRCWRLLAYDEIITKQRIALLHRRKLLAEFVLCPWCLGAWLSLGIYLLWVWVPTAALLVAVPFALSAAVGLINRLDP